MSLFTPMRALTVIIEWGLDALATILDPGPGVPAEYLWNVGADELAEDEAEEEVGGPRLMQTDALGYHADGTPEAVAFSSSDFAEFIGCGGGGNGSSGGAASSPGGGFGGFPGLVFTTYSSDAGSGNSPAIEKRLHAWRESFGRGPIEPALTPDELVGIRQLLEERFGFTTPCADDAAGDPGPAAQDGPAPGNSTGKVTPGAGQPTSVANNIWVHDSGPNWLTCALSRDDLLDAARAVRYRAEGVLYPQNSGRWHALAARLEDAATSTPN